MDPGLLLGALIAAGWGAIAGAALLAGALLALLMPVNLRAVGAIMGFGAGVLIGAVAFELTVDAMNTAGLTVAGLAMLFGALVYIAGDWTVSNAGAHRRNSPLHGGAHPAHHGRLSLAHRLQLAKAGPVPASAPEVAATPAFGAQPAVGMVLVIGALLDGIPESAAIGIGLLDGGELGLAFLAAVFLSNLPESLAATTGLRAAGRSAKSIITLWLVVIVTSAVAAGLGYAVLGGLGPTLHGSIQAFAAGAVLAMIATTMLPEAVDHAGRLVGLVTVLGFASSVLLGAI